MVGKNKNKREIMKTKIVTIMEEVEESKKIQALQLKCCNSSWKEIGK